MSRKLLKQIQGGGARPLAQSAAVAAQGGSGNAKLFGITDDFAQLVELDIACIAPNRDQPRRHFDEAALQALAKSIARHGVRQPIGVRPEKSKGDGRYEIVWGERRWRASALAGKTVIPAMLVKDDADPAELALVENLQRVDLDAMETARGLSALRDRHDYTHEELAAVMGLDRTKVGRMLRLLELPAAILDEYPEHRERVSMSTLFEIANTGDPDLQLQLWGQAKAGLTVKAMREAKGAPARPPEPAAVLTKIQRGVERTLAVINQAREQGAVPDADQRAALRSLRDRIDQLLGA